MKTLVTALALVLVPLTGCATPTAHTAETTESTPTTHRVCGTLLVADGGGGMPSPDPGWKPIEPSEYPIAATDVRLLRLADGSKTPGAEVARVTTGPDGTFCAEVPAGSYAVVVTESTARHATATQEGGLWAQARADVVVGGVDVVGVVLRIQVFRPV